jgi:hypothetical protein
MPHSTRSSDPSRLLRLASCCLLASATLAGAARASDLVVDATGAAGSFLNVSQAMAAAVPGDRILVKPGAYPAFQFERGVSVIGMGASASDVLITRVDFHVSIPNVGYDTLLSNMTVGDGTSSNALAITGNELNPGSFVVDGVHVKGGVFLGGGADGFYTLFNNSSVDAPPGFGFAGAAMYLGGKPGFSADLVNSRVDGWNADPSQGIAAGSGLLLAGGMRARVARSIIRGGDGSTSLPAGADAIRSGGAAAVVSLRVDGSTVVQGGDAASGGAGGDGVDVFVATELGDAIVTGGAGSPAGVPFPQAPPVEQPAAAHLDILPVHEYALGQTFLKSGSPLSFAIDAPSNLAAIALAFQLDMPSPSLFLCLHQPLDLLVFGNQLETQVPSLPGLDLPGVMVFAQGFVRPAGGGPLVLTNVAAVRMDLQAGPPGGP